MLWEGLHADFWLWGWGRSLWSGPGPQRAASKETGSRCRELNSVDHAPPTYWTSALHNCMMISSWGFTPPTSWQFITAVIENEHTPGE